MNALLELPETLLVSVLRHPVVPVKTCGFCFTFELYFTSICGNSFIFTVSVVLKKPGCIHSVSQFWKKVQRKWRRRFRIWNPSVWNSSVYFSRLFWPGKTLVFQSDSDFKEYVGQSAFVLPFSVFISRLLVLVSGSFWIVCGCWTEWVFILLKFVFKF